MFKDDITGRLLPVSSHSASIVNRALVAAHRAGVISNTEYKMVYAEICEPGYLPQAFGGRVVPPEILDKWKDMRSWTLYSDEEFAC